MRLPTHPCTRSIWKLSLGGLILATWCVLISCGGPDRPPESDIPGYDQLRDRLGDHDFSPLQGRRVVLDPGHGGRFRGAVGLNGLTEAEVNLGVALYLRGLLEWAGAQVYMTRTADHDLLAPGDSSLTNDLAARVAFNDSIQPDVFVSIHHNSNAELDRDLNETQTYYPVGRAGADLDLARAIHKYLVRNLEIDPAKIMAGNFYVLRHATVPAVLGEPSMISNPVIEKRLSLAAKQELEAKAYFLGLLEYFAGGTPRFVHDHGDTLRWQEHPTSWLSWYFDGGDPAAPGLDPDTVEFRVGGRQVPLTVEPDGHTLIWFPDAVDIGNPNTITLTARNLAGRATPLLRLQILADDADLPAFASRIVHEDSRRSSPRALFVWQSLGHPLAELPPLWLTRGTGDDPCAEQIARLPDFPGHEGWLLLPADRVDKPADGDLRICHTPDDAIAPSALAATLQPEIQRLAADQRWCVLARQPGFWPGSVLPGGTVIRRLEPSQDDPGEGFPLAGYPTWPVCPIGENQPVWFEAAGALPIVATMAPPATDQPDTFWWQPVLADLIDRVIVIDPTGGGSESDGTGPLGTRGADLNLRVAEMTAVLLRGAGAQAILTREGEAWLPPEQKVALANRHRTDLFLTIGRSSGPANSLIAHHHPGSKIGRRWADLFARAAAPLLPLAAPADSVIRTGPSHAYLLRHTASPALMVGLETPHSLAAEERLNNTSYQQAQARALFLSIAAVFAGEDLLTRQIELGELLASRRDLLPNPAEITWLKWDGNFPWLPPSWSAAPGDSLSFPETPGLPAETDRHYLEIRTRTEWQLWSLIPSATGAWVWHRVLGGKIPEPPPLRSLEARKITSDAHAPARSASAGGSHP